MVRDDNACLILFQMLFAAQLPLQPKHRRYVVTEWTRPSGNDTFINHLHRWPFFMRDQKTRWADNLMVRDNTKWVGVWWRRHEYHAAPQNDTPSIRTKIDKTNTKSGQRLLRHETCIFSGICSWWVCVRSTYIIHYYSSSAVEDIRCACDNRHVHESQNILVISKHDRSGNRSPEPNTSIFGLNQKVQLPPASPSATASMFGCESTISRRTWNLT